MTRLDNSILFLATANPERARDFYERVLGLKFVADEWPALVFRVGDRMLRIQKVEQITIAPYTALGWEVADIRQAVRDLQAAGVAFQRFPGMNQDADMAVAGRCLGGLVSGSRRACVVVDPVCAMKGAQNMQAWLWYAVGVALRQSIFWIRWEPRKISEIGLAPSRLSASSTIRINKDKSMKTIHKILLVTAAAASFTLIDRAGDARAQENQPVIVPGVNNDPDLLQYNANGNARMAEQTASTAMAPNANSDRDPNLLSEIAAMPGTGKQKDQAQLQLQAAEVAPEVAVR